jgi:hypothetical protein
VADAAKLVRIQNNSIYSHEIILQKKAITQQAMAYTLSKTLVMKNLDYYRIVRWCICTCLLHSAQRLLTF